MLLEKRKRDLIQAITLAFKDVLYPGDDNITRCLDDDGQEVIQKLRGKHWRDLSEEMPGENGETLGFLTPEAFLFFLPAFMLYTIQGKATPDFVGHVIHTLTPLGKDFDDLLVLILDPFPDLKENCRKNLPNVFPQRIAKVHDEQKKVVRQYLEYLREAFPVEFNREASIALERYWKEFKYGADTWREKRN